MRKIKPGKKDIVFMTNGGIGDQIAFKPVVAYAMKNYLKDDTISIVSDYDWIWKDLVHYTYTTKNPCPAMETTVIKEIYPINTPSPIDYQASHSTTFASINLMRREIPLKDRQPKFKLKPEHYKKTKHLPHNNLFLIHPNLTWASRTLEASVWQGWIDVISDLGFHTCLIGQDMELETAYNEKYNMRKGAIQGLETDFNFINKLEPLESMALMEKSFGLLTADGGPLHMAGCFNNYIFSFCSTRMPEYLFTWRGPNYEQSWKARPIEKEELFYGVYDFNPFVQTGTNTAVEHLEELKKVTPSPKELRKIIEDTINIY